MGTHICSNMRPVAEFLDGFWVVIFSIYIYIYMSYPICECDGYEV